MKIIGHHTCSSTGTIQEIEQNGPFLSTHIQEDSKQHKFLGTGYYFWDNNLKMAHVHGQNNYKRKYYIFEADLNMVEDWFLDLAGNRIDMLHFQAIMDRLIENDVTKKDWTLAHFIEFLKTKEIFLYRAIRTIDTSAIPKEVIKFVANRDKFTNLHPVFIVCLLDNGMDIINSFKHIKTFPNHG
jgi:hypothetical protein